MRGREDEEEKGEKNEALNETGGLATGTHDNHMLGDLRDMTAQEEKTYLASAKKTQ